MTTPSTNRYQWSAYKIGEPVTSGSLTVFPVFTDGDRPGPPAKQPGDYMLLSTAVEKKLARVTELHESGSVPVIAIENGGKLPLLGIQGEEYVGAKQNRTLNITVLVGPGKTEIPVTCVEQGRWDRGGGVFEAGAYEPVAMRAMKSEHIGRTRRNVKDKIKRYFADQGAVWNAVEKEGARHGVRSRTSALGDVFKSGKVSDSVDDLIEGVVLPDGATGAVVAIGGRLAAADLFEHGTVFERMWPRILRSYAYSALPVRSKGVPPSVEAAQTFLSRPNELTWSATPSVGLGEDVRWEDDRTTAAALVWQNRFLHAAVFEV
jgi:hypothetical protein